MITYLLLFNAEFVKESRSCVSVSDSGENSKFSEFWSSLMVESNSLVCQIRRIPYVAILMEYIIEYREYFFRFKNLIFGKCENHDKKINRTSFRNGAMFSL